MSPTQDTVLRLGPGAAVGEYRITRLIGEGGMGEVYAGEQPLIGKAVAIKVLSSRLLDDPSTPRRLLEEARAVNQIRHPNIIDIFSFGTLPDGRPYYVMELLEGENLESALGRGWMEPAALLTLMEQLCRTLEAAHAAGFVHRDLKPENLWLSRKPDQSMFLKVLDFGIAKNTGPTSPGLTARNQVLGTAHYMAPEQALAKAVDARTDIYAVGVILYRILAGVLPFDHPNDFNVVAKHVTEAPKPISAHRPIPAPVEAVVMRCLAKDPAERPQTIDALWTELRPGLEAWRVGTSASRVTMAAPPAAAPAPSPVVSKQRSSINPKDNSRATIQAIERSAPHAIAEAPRKAKWAVPAGIGVAVLLVGAVAVYPTLTKPARAPTPPLAIPAAIPTPALPAADASGPRRVFERADGGADTHPDVSPSILRPLGPRPVKHENRDPVRL